MNDSRRRCRDGQTSIAISQRDREARRCKTRPREVSSGDRHTCTISATRLQRVLGMVMYLSRYVPNMSARIAQLRLLLGNESEWQWHAEQEMGWLGIKETLSRHPGL